MGARVRITAHFERSLAQIEDFLEMAQASEAFDSLLSQLADTVIPNLERFPGMGRPFLETPVRSVEAAGASARLRAQLHRIAHDAEIREYVMSNHIVLYARMDNTVHLLSIRHHRQLSFDLGSLWIGA